MINLKNFKAKEFDCPCCGLHNMDNNFIRKLDNARDYAGVSFILNSAYRCKKHNLEVGGSETSSHIKGLAVDIKCNNSRKRFKIINALIKVGFNRIGIAKTFIHIDDDPNKDQEVVWLY